jgi:hypothetical protein
MGTESGFFLLSREHCSLPAFSRRSRSCSFFFGEINDDGCSWQERAQEMTLLYSTGTLIMQAQFAVASLLLLRFIFFGQHAAVAAAEANVLLRFD